MRKLKQKVRKESIGDWRVIESHFVKILVKVLQLRKRSMIKKMEVEERI